MTEFTTPAEAAPAEAPKTPEAPKTDRPSWLPEKFESPEKMAEAYAALEKKMGSGEAVNPEASKPPQGMTPASVQSDLQDKGVDFDALVTEVDTNGKLSDASYAKLQEAGYSRAIVDNYIEGQQAIGEQQIEAIAQSVGGRETMEAVLQWAGSNVEEIEKTAFNDAVSAGNWGAVRMALSGLHSRFTAANGREANLISGQPGKAPSNGFQSMYEMKAAMRDKRYGRDPAYMKEVEGKIRNSNF